MLEVASLRYGVIFKKAFCVPEIFTAFVQDVIGIAIEIDKVDIDKSFNPAIGAVNVKFDLYAEDLKNGVIVNIQHERLRDPYHRFLYNGCVAIMEQIANSKNYLTNSTVYVLVILTSDNGYEKDIFITDMTPRHRDGTQADETHHKIIYLAPKYVNHTTPEPIREWLQAINDSLDDMVDEQAYERPEIRQFFDLIQKTSVTPQDRAKMIDEYHQEEINEKAFQKGIEMGKRRIQRRTLTRQLQRKFGDVPAPMLAKIEETDDMNQLDIWLDDLLDAITLDDIGLMLDT